MAGLIGQLLENLSEQIDLYETLLTFSNDKKTVIIKNDLPELQKITAGENIVIGKLQRLDKIRAELLADIADVLNEDKNKTTLTLTVLIEKLEGQEEAAPLSAIKAKLKELTDELKKINDQNKDLINNSLDYINFSMTLLQDSIGGNSSYYNTRGEEIDTGKRGFFDAKQ